MLPLARATIGRRLAKRTADPPVNFLLLLRALIDATTRVFMFAIAIYLALRWLKIPPRAEKLVDTSILVVTWWQVGHWLSALVRHLIEVRRGREFAGTEGAASLNILRFVAVMIVWIIAVLMLLTNLGVKVGPLIAGLGIGGVAIALALQNLLGDLFASLSIALDKPFRVGDFLAIGEERGTVEQIGIKSTRLRSVTGEQIVMSNGDVLKSRVRNYGLIPERRAELQLRIAYETPRKLIAEVPKMIEAAIRAENKVRFERAHFARYGDYAFIFEAVYYVQDSELQAFMDAQQSINLRVLDEFSRRGVTLAYPTSRSMAIQPPAPPEAAS
ncbi:MAG TPA: mechanosensitive ion channel family protein [Myxococcota bacterium]|nr:mechanosensitive ion channel family protein [Myxococcota bacterium]